MLSGAISDHGIGEHGGLDGDRARGRLSVLHRLVPAIDLGMATLIGGGDAWWQLSVAEPDFDPGGPLRT